MRIYFLMAKPVLLPKPMFPRYDQLPKSSQLRAYRKSVNVTENKD